MDKSNRFSGNRKIGVLILGLGILMTILIVGLPQVPIFSDNAESGINGWTPTGLWHITAGKYSSPNHSWWYGQEATGNYQTGKTRNSGYLTSPPIYIKEGANLSFMSWYQTETGTAYDKKFIQISTDNGSTWASLRQILDTQSTWNKETISLSGFAGKTARIRFYFDTIDGIYNAYNGWYIDDIKIEIPKPPEPLNVSVWESPDPVTSGETSQVTVHVTTTGGVPVSGASVNLSVTGGILAPASGTTDASGDFISTYTAPVTAATSVKLISVSVSKTDHIPATASGQITVTPRLYVSIPNTSVIPGIPSPITVRVTNIEGVPVRGASVSVSATSGILSPASGATDANGTFALSFTAPDEPAINMISATATNAGYTEGGSTVAISINPSILIRSGDGLELSLTQDGNIKNIYINGTPMPMLDTRGGFSYREVLSDPPNLVENPGFESVVTSPANWSIITVNENTPEWDNISHSGTRSIKISVPGYEDNYSGYPRSDYVKAEPLKDYTLSAWVKTLDANGTYGPGVRIVELDAGKKWLQETNIAFGKGTKDWTQKQVTFKTTQNTSFVYVYTSIWNGYGTFWVDDVIFSGLSNGGFENSMISPMNWSFITNNENTPIWDNISHGGTRSIKISISGTKDNQSGYPKSDLIKAEPLAYYTLSAWVKTKGAAGTNAPAVQVVELDATNKWLHQTNLVFSNGTNDWTQKQVTFQTGFDTSYLYIYGNIWNGYGTFWMDDIELSPLFGPTIYLNGKLKNEPDGTVTQRAEVDNIDFTFHYIPKGMQIELQGEIEDKKGVNRALQVLYNLPVNADGWRWGDYIRGSRVINDSTHYENVYNMGNVRTQSTYPFASIDNNIHGLSLAVPMDVPRIYRNGYDLSDGYSIQYDFGLSNQTLKIGPGFANFTFEVYKIDEPEWGFRSVVKKYYEMYPQFFEKRAKKDGMKLFQQTLMEPIENATDFGFAFDDFSFDKYNFVFDDKYDVYQFKNMEPWVWWRNFGSVSKQPSYEERLNALFEDSSNGTGISLNAPVKEVAKATINSGIYNSTKQYYIDIERLWVDWGNGWTQAYPTNTDPDIQIPNRYYISNDYELENATDDINKDIGLIDEWVFYDHWMWDNTTSFYNSGHSAKINISSNIIKSGIWKYGYYIPVERSSSYQLSTWIKSQNVSGGGVGVILVEIDSEGNINWNSQKGIYSSGTSNWKFRTLTFNTTSLASKLYLFMSIYNGSGTAWFDNLSLIKKGTEKNLIENSGFEENRNFPSNLVRFDGVNLDGVAASNWNPYGGPLENYRKEHWKYTDFPIVFSYSSKEPILLNAFSQYEFINAISDLLRARNKLLMANIDDKSGIYYHLLDIITTEIAFTDYDSTDLAMSTKRTLSYKKPISNVLQWNWGKGNLVTRNDMERYIKNNLLYGMFPSIASPGMRDYKSYWSDPTLYNRDRDLFRKYIPLIKEISKAGWEPITYAEIDNDKIEIERYGGINSSSIYFTLYNTDSNMQNYSLTFDLAKLGFNGFKVVEITDMVTGNLTKQTYYSKVDFSGTMNPEDIIVFSVRPSSS